MPKNLKQKIRQRLMSSKRTDSQTSETIPQLVMNEGMDMIVSESAEMINEILDEIFTELLSEQTHSGLVPVSVIRRIFDKENY